MRVCFYSPYLPDSSIGGGEKHLFDMVEVIAQKHDVSISIPSHKLGKLENQVESYKKFLGTDDLHATFVMSPLGTNAPFLKKLLWTRQFDYFFYWTDGSLFLSLAKRNNLHLQIPFSDKKTGFLNRLKLLNWNIKNANSEFTKNVIEKSWHTRVQHVVYPMVDLDELKTDQKKEKVILSVGRFFRQLHSKRQDILVENFKTLIDANPKLSKGWKLVLIGAPEDQEYFNAVRESADGYPIEVYGSLSRNEIINWFKRAAIYWHATGFEIDEKLEPEKVEHFGITTIEAMAAGAVPVVLGKGGQVEILGTRLKKLMWQEGEECNRITMGLMDNLDELERYRGLVEERSKIFGQDAFEKAVWRMF